MEEGDSPLAGGVISRRPLLRNRGPVQQGSDLRERPAARGRLAHGRAHGYAASGVVDELGRRASIRVNPYQRLWERPSERHWVSPRVTAGAHEGGSGDTRLGSSELRGLFYSMFV